MGAHAILGEPMDTIPMGTREVKIDAKELVIHPLSDIHIGASAHDYRKLKARVDLIAKAGSNHRILLLGDLADIAIKSSVSFSHGALTPEDELEDLVRVFEPVADRIDLIIPGNHERRIHREVGLDYTRQFAALLRIPKVYRSSMTLLQYSYYKRAKKPTDKNKTYYCKAKVLCHHGYGGGRTSGAKLNKIADLAKIVPDAHVYLMGHVHDKVAKIDAIYLGYPPEKLERAFVITGCYLDYEAYAMDFAFTPPSTGSPTIYLGSNKIRKPEVRVLLS